MLFVFIQLSWESIMGKLPAAQENGWRWTKDKPDGYKKKEFIDENEAWSICSEPCDETALGYEVSLWISYHRFRSW